MLSKSDLKQIQQVVQKENSPIVRDIKTIKSDVSQIRKDIKTIVNYFDREYLELRKRVERIEEHLNLEPPPL